MTDSIRLAELEAEARYAREGYQLYRAKAYGPRLTSAGHLRELERKSKLAERRYRAAAERERHAGGAPALLVAVKRTHERLTQLDRS